MLWLECLRYKLCESVNMCFDFKYIDHVCNVLCVSNGDLSGLTVYCHSRASVVPSGGECNALNQTFVNRSS